jgi:hypothetical protein
MIFHASSRTFCVSIKLRIRLPSECFTSWQVVVCGDEVTNGKPDPEIFMKAAKQLGVGPEECLVIEDAPSGIQVCPFHEALPTLGRR